MQASRPHRELCFWDNILVREVATFIFYLFAKKSCIASRCKTTMFYVCKSLQKTMSASAKDKMFSQTESKEKNEDTLQQSPQVKGRQKYWEFTLFSVENRSRLYTELVSDLG